MILFVQLVSVTIYFGKGYVYHSIHDNFEPIIPLKEVENLSNSEIVEKLFTMYLDHYKDKPILDDQRIEDYKLIKTTERYAVADGTAFSIIYSIQQYSWNDYWELGGYRTTDGEKRHSVFVNFIKEKDQFRLKIMGTFPPDPK